MWSAHFAFVIFKVLEPCGGRDAVLYVYLIYVSVSLTKRKIWREIVACTHSDHHTIYLDFLRRWSILSWWGSSIRKILPKRGSDTWSQVVLKSSSQGVTTVPRAEWSRELRCGREQLALSGQKGLYRLWLIFPGKKIQQYFVHDNQTLSKGDEAKQYPFLSIPDPRLQSMPLAEAKTTGKHLSSSNK